jgi:alpha-tubulin suppressor-like RCC1 family protein
MTIATGGGHSLALKNDGTIWAWGWDAYGQLGNGLSLAKPCRPYRSEGSHDSPHRADWSYDDSNLPVPVLEIVKIIAIAGGGLPSLALREDGTVWAWGSNYYGQIGNRPNTWCNVPVQVLGLAEVVAIAGGDNHSLALKSDGTVWAWGVTLTVNSATGPIPIAMPLSKFWGFLVLRL